MSKRKSGPAVKYIPEFMRARSEASKKAWEKRWDRGTAPIGKKGQQYLEKTYGPIIDPRDYPDEEEYDDFDFYDPDAGTL